ncbi:MAG TPA: respiratory chain complex I subunit 1 family protein [Thermococcaceae archaeon]|jgi:formate hydrogenlyase subunit 4|nr:MAG: Membrane-bound hydrogenase MBH 1, subunit Mbh1M (Hydrogenase subunit) [Thermococcales archaeon 44_46]HIH73153.1 respiratory chain complex I subunit 1 family protein [Thermococcaceae archaeon]HII67563.1 respiratory chain complex I subunit 1 family protein [Thermococcaceae archaeon]
MNIAYLTLGLIAIYLYVSFVSLIWEGVDRKLVARMQRRIGPPVLQPIYDFLKLVSKESIIPRDANKFFEIAPVLALASSIALLAYTPLGFEPLLATKGDVIVFIYLLALIAFVRVMGAVSSGSPYAQIGAQREIIMLASREVPMMLGLFAILWRLSKLGVEKPFSLGTFYQYNIWEIGTPLTVFGTFVLFIVFLLWLASEIEVGYFNIPEAETEVAEGPMAEYSGRHLALFKLSSALKEFASASLVVAIFFPWGISGYLGLTGIGAVVLDLLFHTLKVFIVLFVSMSVFRAITGRLRITQAVGMFWGRILPMSFIGVLLIVIDVLGVIA